MKKKSRASALSFYSILAFGLITPACGQDHPEQEPHAEGIARRQQGWLRGDLHLHSTYSDGDDPPAVVVKIGEYLENGFFLRAHPEYQGNGLDFLAITDHRNVEAHTDPGWKSDRLILIGGMEWGGPAHANCIGIKTAIKQDPDGDGVNREDVLRSIRETHQQGGIFSANHPFYTGSPFFFDVREHDSIEVWNSGFGLMSPTFTPADLEEIEASEGPASPFFKKAAARQDVGGSYQALILYEAFLSRGVHLALVGGSDRHTLLPLGFPATWVRADSADSQGVLDAIRARRTFVSRGPAAAQVLLAVKTGSSDKTYEMGDAIPVAAAGENVTVIVRAGRAKGGRLLLMGGGYLERDDQLATAELSRIVLEAEIDSDHFSRQVALSAKPGDWLYPQVWEPLLPPGFDPAREGELRELAAQVVRAKAEDFLGLASVLINYIPSIDLVLNATLCDITEWEPDLAQCMAADDNGMATFFMPDFIDRAFNAIMKDGRPTDWCMGAVGSAVRFVEK